MSIYLTLIRRLSTTSTLRQSFLSANYKSNELWEKRFQCELLSNDEYIKKINNKIITGNFLENHELDMFINISSPALEEIAQLQESLRLVGIFRKSLHAHTLLPSTPHAFCRLFLNSNRNKSLLRVLEQRVDYGIFPDFMATNLILDQALERKDYLSASRMAALVMLQEDFGTNSITDALSIYALSKYVESKTDFSDWTAATEEASRDPILNPASKARLAGADEEEVEKKEVKKEEDEEEEEEEEAVYIRVPFLRNPYFDNHFDLENPRAICGKSLSMVAGCYQNEQLASRANIIGLILQGKWLNAISELEKDANVAGSIKELALHYTNNLHGLEEPDSDVKKKLLTSLQDEKSTTSANPSVPLSHLAEEKCRNLEGFEKTDIEEFNKTLPLWTKLRSEELRKKEEKLRRDKIIAEIKAKKENLKQREEFLYFYDKLKKSKITKIDYN